MNIGEKIQRLRRERGVSQEQLSEQLSEQLAVSRQAISKWELGESMPETENVVRLSRLFGVSADFLLNDDFESDLTVPSASGGRNALRKAAFWLVGVGLLGIMVLWILSSVIPADKRVNDPNGGQISIDLATGEETEIPSTDKNMTFFKTIKVRGDLGAFLAAYHFKWLFVLCCASVLVGGIGILRLRPKTETP